MEIQPIQALIKAESAAIDFFAENAKVPLESITVSSSNRSRHSGVTHVYLQQVINGLQVSNGVGNVNVDKHGQILSIGKSFYTGPVPSKESSGTPKLTPVDSVVSIGNFLNLQNTGTLTQAVSLSINGTPGFTVTGASFALKDIPVVLKYFQVNGGSQLRLVWSLEVETRDNMYNAFVDANNGEVVGLNDWVSDTTRKESPGINDPSGGVKIPSYDFVSLQ